MYMQLNETRGGVEVQTFGEIIDRIKGIYRRYPKIRKKVQKDVNMSHVGLRNTRILTDCAQKSPQTLILIEQKIAYWVTPKD